VVRWQAAKDDHILRDDHDVCGAFSLQLRTASTLQLTACDGNQMRPL